jgi:hypothetical protein
MATALPIEIFELLEKKVGKDEAKEVIKIIDASLESIEKKAEAVALQKKLEIKEELTKELVTKAEFFGEMKALRTEFFGETRNIRQEMQTIKTELEGKIEKLNQKFNFMIILIIIALTLMNPVMAEIIKGLLKL